jgi:hypothetical protein
MAGHHLILGELEDFITGETIRDTLDERYRQKIARLLVIVTRRRPVLAASRLLTSYQIPIAVVTNGEDAEIIDGFSGNILSQGLETIPARSELVKTAEQNEFKSISNLQVEIESRIVYCYEVDGSCPCDEDICRL